GLGSQTPLVGIDAHHPIFDPFHEGIENSCSRRTTDRFVVATLIPLGSLAGDAILLKRRIGGDYVYRSGFVVEPRRGKSIIDAADGGMSTTVSRQIDPCL